MSALSLLVASNFALTAFLPIAHVAPPRARVVMAAPDDANIDSVLDEYAAALVDEAPEYASEAFGKIDVSEVAKELKKPAMPKVPELPKVDMPKVDWAETLAIALVSAETIKDTFSKVTTEISEAAKENDVEFTADLTDFKPKEALDALSGSATKAKDVADKATEFAAEHDLGWKARAVFELVADEVSKATPIAPKAGKKAPAPKRKAVAKAPAFSFSFPTISMPKMAAPKKAAPKKKGFAFKMPKF